MKLKAYSKINLCLKVFSKTNDEKLHKIDSIFCLNKRIYDSIYIKKAKKLLVQYKINNKITSFDDCLISKTLKYLNQKYNIGINYSILVKKNIPIGAGLGGGSSNAAAIIKYLISKEKNVVLDMEEICFNLGSDIPFFLSNFNIARVTNYGDIVCKIYNWKPKFKVFLNNIICSTKKVFLALDNDKNFVSKVNVDEFIDNFIIGKKIKNIIFYNDLTKYIIMINSKLETIYKKYPSNYFFSGSGSAIVTLNK